MTHSTSFSRIESLLDAMYLSLEVGTTIGWGLPGSPYMKAEGARGGCMSGIFIIYLHTLVMQIQNAIMIGLMFCRLSRGTSRAASLIFTDKAVIREIGGKFFFMIQVCEQRKHQLVEAKIRCYALSTTVVGQTINGATGPCWEVELEGNGGWFPYAMLIIVNVLECCVYACMHACMHACMYA
eukprot:s41_g30.t1